MSDTPLELFKADDFDYALKKAGSEIAADANWILSKRLRVGYVATGSDYAKGSCSAITNKNCETDTHQIYYHLIPLETKEPECEHIFKSATSYESQYETVYKWINNKFCPKCGKQL